MKIVDQSLLSNASLIGASKNLDYSVRPQSNCGMVSQNYSGFGEISKKA